MNQNQFSNPFAFSDYFKNVLDFNQVFTLQRRNAEAVTAATQVLGEGAQAMWRAGAEASRSNMEAVLKSSRDMMSGGTPDVSKQANVARSIFENTLVNLREATEMATKCGFEAFQVLNERATESVSEASKSAPRPKKK